MRRVLTAVILAVAAIVVGCERSAPDETTTADRQRAVAEITKWGGTITWEQGRADGPVVEIDLNKNLAVSDAGLENLKSLSQLRKLSLDDTKVTDAGLVSLKNLRQLETLELNGTAITDAGLADLKDLEKLQQLGLARTKVTDAGLGALKGLDQLHELILPQGITDAGLEQLKGLGGLRFLALTGNAVTDGGVKKFKEALPGCMILQRPPAGLPGATVR